MYKRRELMVDIDEPTSGTSTPPAPVLPKPSARSKWQDEDKEESEEVGLFRSRLYLPIIAQKDEEGKGRYRGIKANRQDDWDVSDSEKTKKTAAPTTTAAPPKKKLTLKQKLAEKERLAAERVSPSEGVSPSLRQGHYIRRWTQVGTKC
jgi:translation initiation factor 3 subunit J